MLIPWSDKPNPKLKTLLNPTTEDYSVTYDLGDGEGPVSYTAPAMELSTFASPVADHIANHLADKILQSRNTSAGSYQQAKEAVLKEIM